MTDTTAKPLRQLSAQETRRIVDAVFVCHELVRLDAFVGPLYGQCTCGRVFPVSVKGKTGIDLHREHIWSVLIEQAEVRGVTIDITQVGIDPRTGVRPDASGTQETDVPELSEEAVMDAFRTRAPVTYALFHEMGSPNPFGLTTGRFLRNALEQVGRVLRADLERRSRVSPLPTVVHSIEDVGGGP